jgi:hypothetical protein
MKKLTSIAIACLLVLSVVPAMAVDQAGSNREPVMSQAVDKVPVTFQAFSNLPATEREALTPLTETELASIEGSSDICITCLNLAIVTQTNTCVVCGIGSGGFLGVGIGTVRQSNDSHIRQDIN